MAGWTPTSPLAKVVNLAGFEYDPGQDIIYTKMDPLQRQFGFCYGYDANVMAISADIDCEPIFFEYADKSWMIELWKGQYGVETGCEIGIYNRPASGSLPPLYPLLDETIGKRPVDPDPAHGKFFRCADDTELLEMSITLKRNGEEVFHRKQQRHWWLTGFKWGVYSKPQDLVMDVYIAFPADQMRDSFVRAATAMGYNVTVNGLAVTFEFSSPRAPQPPRDANLLALVRAQDAAIVSTYNTMKQAQNLSTNDPNQINGPAVNEIVPAVLGLGPGFFGKIMTEALGKAGKNVDEIAGLFVNELKFAAGSVSEWITDAGYGLSQWVESLKETVKVELGLDFSCAVEIVNTEANGKKPPLLTRTGYDIKKRSVLITELTCGSWAIDPPSAILPGETGRFYLKDDFNGVGAEGWAEYSYVDADGATRSLRFEFGCPTGFDDNYASDGPSSPYRVWARSGSDTGWKDSVPTAHHPLNVAYVWAQGPAPA
jgi:hypothetical protein